MKPQAVASGAPSPSNRESGEVGVAESFGCSWQADEAVRKVPGGFAVG